MVEVFQWLDVEFIEQLFVVDNYEGMGEFVGCVVLLIIVDESCLSEGDVVDCFYQGFYGINIKFCKCGGFMLVW